MFKATALLALVLGLVSASTADDGEALRFQDIASGVWGFNVEGAGCEDNPHTIGFSEDGRTMSLQYAKGAADEPAEEVVYHVISEGPGFLRMKIEGEERRTEDEETVVWDLVLLSADSYCWHRTDWQPGGCTQPATRCEPDSAEQDSPAL